MESSGKTETVTLDRKSMNKLLKSVIHYYEVFCWEEDYICGTYPDDETQDDDNDDSPVWRIHIEYLNGETQDIQSSDDIPYKVEELARGTCSDILNPMNSTMKSSTTRVRRGYR